MARQSYLFGQCRRLGASIGQYPITIIRGGGDVGRPGDGEMIGEPRLEKQSGPSCPAHGQGTESLAPYPERRDTPRFNPTRDANPDAESSCERLVLGGDGPPIVCPSEEAAYYSLMTVEDHVHASFAWFGHATRAQSRWGY